VGGDRATAVEEQAKSAENSGFFYGSTDAISQCSKTTSLEMKSARTFEGAGAKTEDQ
jgi:hypothetical protein